MRALSPALTDDFSGEEIIVGSLCGKVYFIDFASGRASRLPLEADNPIKGTPSLDPRLNGLLYIGQGIPCSERFGALAFARFDHREAAFFGRDPRALRGWNAYDSSPVVAGGFLFRPGENGSVYKLGCDGRGVRLHSVLRYRDGRGRAPGIESSMAVYRNYGYAADNAGNIICIDLNTLRPVWVYDNHDDTDATPLLEIERGRPVLYTACEVDKQGDEGFSYMVKLDALTGRLLWERPVPCRKFAYAGKVREGGMFASPLAGGGDCAHLLFSNFCGASDACEGVMIAFDKRSGEVVYRRPSPGRTHFPPDGRRAGQRLSDRGVQRPGAVRREDRGQFRILAGRRGRPGRRRFAGRQDLQAACAVRFGGSVPRNRKRGPPGKGTPIP